MSEELDINKILNNGVNRTREKLRKHRKSFSIFDILIFKNVL